MGDFRRGYRRAALQFLGHEAIRPRPALGTVFARWPKFSSRISSGRWVAGGAVGPTQSERQTTADEFKNMIGPVQDAREARGLLEQGPNAVAFRRMHSTSDES